jgi:branched-chain amino acid transport system substrate-binding protein
VFAIADDWWIARVNEILKDGIIAGDGKKRMIELVVKDSQSTTDRASQVAGDLVQNDKVDMLLASGTPDTANPTADQGEALGCPVLLSFAPWQALFFGADGKAREFKWVYGNMLGSEETIAAFTDAFDNSGVLTNKKVGMLFQNDADYKGWMDPSAAPKVFAEKGYTLVTPDPYSIPAEDFTSQISKFKGEGCEIICGTNDPPWLSNFLTQSLQQNFKPTFISSGKGLIFPQAVLSYPNKGLGLVGEAAWHPSWKIKDTLDPTMDSESLAADFEAKTGQQWTASIGCYGKTEWAIDVYKRAKNPEDKESVLEAIKTTKGTFQQGKIDYTEAVDPNGFHPIANNYKPYIGAQQWRKGTKYEVEPVVVSNAAAPGTTVQDKVQPMVYA